MPMFKKQMVVVLAIALTAIVGTMYATTSEEVVRLDAGVERADRIDDERSSAPTVGKIFVYVTGAVNSPGMIELNGSDFHLADAVNAAGGLLPTADADALNMADQISDGQHIRVPEK
ncbi:MAG: SLBB domain-containing protein, partial [Selenomonadaceae bacterium]|nr:SLBB domain-containing protein [Selenomonadaceae bacterium]